MTESIHYGRHVRKGNIRISKDCSTICYWKDIQEHRFIVIITRLEIKHC